MSDFSPERIQKILSRLGIASRRKAEELIIEGAVTVNGRTAVLGEKAVFGQDSIKVNGKLLVHAPTPVYYAFYKPRQVICAMEDPEGRPALKDYLDRLQHRVYPVGRMDFNSEGLLLLTNDGEMQEKIQKHPDLLRIYHVKVKGHPNDEMIERVRKGAKILEPQPRLLRPHHVRIVDRFQKKALIEVAVRGSGAFDIKQLFEQRGFLVEKILRYAVGQITLKDLKPGEFMILERSQMNSLVDQADLTLSRFDQSTSEFALIQKKKAAKVGATKSKSRISVRSGTPSGASDRKKAKPLGRSPRFAKKTKARPKKGSLGRIRPKR